MPTKAYKQTRTWICKIVFRCLVLVCTVAATVFGGIKGASTHWTEMVIPFVSSVWSLIDLVLLCVRCVPKPMINIIIDAIFSVALLAIGCYYIPSAFRLKDVHMTSPFRATVLFPICIAAGVIQVILFALDIKSFRDKRRDAKARWRPDSYSMHNGTAESLIPMANRPATGHTAF